MPESCCGFLSAKEKFLTQSQAPSLESAYIPWKVHFTNLFSSKAVSKMLRPQRVLDLQFIFRFWNIFIHFTSSSSLIQNSLKTKIFEHIVSLPKVSNFGTFQILNYGIRDVWSVLPLYSANGFQVHISVQRSVLYPYAKLSFMDDLYDDMF